MKAIDFEQRTCLLAEDQPQYETLPVHINDSAEREFTACFELSPEEIAEINTTGRIWYTQLTFGNPFQPVRMSTQNPFVTTD